MREREREREGGSQEERERKRESKSGKDRSRVLELVWHDEENELRVIANHLIFQRRLNLTLV